MEYTNSPLARADINFGTKKSNPRENTQYNPTGKITRITIHHMAGKMTAGACARMHYSNAKEQSANYYVGNDGEISLGVPESRRAWTSDSRPNDYNAITIEVSNSKTGGNWPVSDAAYKSTIALCIDICKRNGITEINYTGDDKGNLTRHNMFAKTTCPGPYLQARFPEIAARINTALRGESTEPKQNTEPASAESKAEFTPYLVKISCNVLNVRKGPGTNYKIATTVKKGEVYTIVGEEMNGATRWGKLKSGAGYISLSYTRKI